MGLNPHLFRPPFYQGRIGKIDCEHEFAPGIENMTYNSPAPVLADKDGKYSVTQPGIVTDREYL